MSTVYKLLNDIQHILTRPDMYMGENSLKTKDMYIYIPKTNTIIYRKCTFSTGLLKLFDEILMNAVDNLQRKPTLTHISVTITPEYVSITNDGKSIKLTTFEGTDRPTPEILFTRPRSGENFDDNVERIVGGKNGIGCKLTSIFSSKFIIEIVNKHKLYHQIIENNISIIHEPKITKTDSPDYVKITFYPDLSRFNVDSITDDMQAIMFKRVHDLSYLPIDLSINNIKLPRLSWNSFVDTYGFDNLTTHISSNAKQHKWYVSFGVADKSTEISFILMVNMLNTFANN